VSTSEAAPTTLIVSAVALSFIVTFSVACCATASRMPLSTAVAKP
jgi:hypothetical protein